MSLRTVLNAVSSFFGFVDQADDHVLPADLPVPVPVKDKSKNEITEPFQDTELKTLLPLCDVFIVHNSRSAFYVNPTQWLKRHNMWMRLDDCSRTSIEIQKDGEVVAAIGWADYHNAPGTSYTFGTFVSRKYQGKGVGVALWKAMMRVSGNKKFRGHAASSKGLALLQSMKDRFPGVVDFDQDDDIRPIRKAGRSNKSKARAYRKARAS